MREKKDWLATGAELLNNKKLKRCPSGSRFAFLLLSHTCGKPVLRFCFYHIPAANRDKSWRSNFHDFSHLQLSLSQRYLLLLEEALSTKLGTHA